MFDLNKGLFSLVSSQVTSAGVSFVGCGSATPTQRITNEMLGQKVDTSDAWIRSRTGIEERRVLAGNETLTDLGAKAALKALEMADWPPESLDLVLLATSTPDDLFGSAPKIQAKIGALNAAAFDLTAACSGFLFALVTASQFLQNRSMQRIVVIGADQLSRWVDWDDRRSCVLFGDAAGAVALEGVSSNENGFIGFKIKSQGEKGDCLNILNKQQSKTLLEEITYSKGMFTSLEMNGQEVYKFAVREVPSILDELLSSYKISPQNLDWLLLHQANQRILDAVSDRFSIPKVKVLSNLSKYGNTNAATIPLMLDEAVRDNRIKNGHLIASSGFGAGLSWGSALFKWHGKN